MATAGDLVVNLSANTSKFTRGIDDAKKRTKSFGESAASSLAGVAAGFVSIGAAVALVRAGIAASGESLGNSRKLDAILASTGNTAGLTREKYDEMATSLQRLTSFEDDAATNAIALLAKLKAIDGSLFERTLKTSADMAAVMGTDLSSAAQTLGKALADPEHGFAKLAKAGYQFTDSQKAAAIAMQESGDLIGAQTILLDGLAASIGGTAEKMADPFTQLSNALGDTTEEVGFLARAFADGLGQGGALDTVGRLNERLKETRELAKNAGTVIGSVFNLEDAFFTTGKGLPDFIDPMEKFMLKGPMSKPPKNGILPDLSAPSGSGMGGKIDAKLAAEIFAKEMGLGVDALERVAEKPAEKLKPTDFGLDEMLRLGGIDDTEDQGPGRTRYGGALEAGSTEAYSAILSAMGATGDSKRLDEIAKASKEQVRLMKKQGITQKTIDLKVVEGFA